MIDFTMVKLTFYHGGKSNFYHGKFYFHKGEEIQGARGESREHRENPGGAGRIQGALGESRGR
jgi:hypothetical protein